MRYQYHCSNCSLHDGNHDVGCAGGSMIPGMASWKKEQAESANVPSMPKCPTRRRRAPQKRAQTVYPSETYEARAKRGRPVVGFSLPQDVVDHLALAAKRTGKTKSELVAEALRTYLEIPE